MRLLLDTQAFLWFLDGNPQLSQTAQALILDAANDKFVSMASPWEVAIKVSKGKLTLAGPVEVVFPTEVQRNGFVVLPIDWPHLGQVCQLPWHHKDPFDRLLIAQAMVEQMAIVSADTEFDKYPITRLW